MTSANAGTTYRWYSSSGRITSRDRVMIDVEDKRFSQYVDSKGTAKKILDNPRGTAKTEKKHGYMEVEMDALGGSTLCVPKSMLKIMEKTDELPPPEVNIPDDAVFPPRIHYYYDNHDFGGKYQWQYHPEKNTHTPVPIVCVGVCRVPGANNRFIRAMAFFRTDDRKPYDVLRTICSEIECDYDLMVAFMKENRLGIRIKKDKFSRRRAQAIVAGRIEKCLASRYAKEPTKVKINGVEKEIHNSRTRGLVTIVGEEHLYGQEKRLLGIPCDIEEEEELDNSERDDES